MTEHRSPSGSRRGRRRAPRVRSRPPRTGSGSSPRRWPTPAASCCGRRTRSPSAPGRRSRTPRPTRPGAAHRPGTAPPVATRDDERRHERRHREERLDRPGDPSERIATVRSRSRPRSGGPLERSRCGRLRAERHRGKRVRPDVQREDLEHTEGEREPPSGERPDHERGEFGDVVGQVVRQEAPDVPEGRPPVLDRRHDRGEVVIEEHEVGRRPSHVRARAPHRNTDVGLLQRRPVVHAVPGHRHDVSSGSERARDPELLLRRDAGHDEPVTVDRRRQQLVVLRQVVAHEHDRLHPEQADAASHRGGGQRMVPVIIATRIPARRQLASASATSGPRRIEQPDETEELEVALRESASIVPLGRDLVATASTRRPFRVSASTARRARTDVDAPRARPRRGALRDDIRPPSRSRRAVVEGRRGTVRPRASAGGRGPDRDRVDERARRSRHPSGRRPRSSDRPGARHGRRAPNGDAREPLARPPRSRVRASIVPVRLVPDPVDPRRSATGSRPRPPLISLRVSVPVLSVQMNVVDPSVSTASSRRTRHDARPSVAHRSRARASRSAAVPRGRARPRPRSRRGTRPRARSRSAAPTRRTRNRRPRRSRRPCEPAGGARSSSGDGVPPAVAASAAIRAVASARRSR